MNGIELAGDKMTMTENAEGEVSITFGDVGTGRACSACNLCCKLVPVPRIGKKAGQRCKFQRAGKGCTIYHVRPMDCRTWSCRWLADAETKGMPRPDRCHYVIDMSYDTIGMISDTGETRQVSALQVWVDPAFPDAHRAPELRAYLDRMGAKWGVPAIIRWSSSRGMILFPPSMTGTGQWFERRQDAEPREQFDAVMGIKEATDAA